MKKPELLAPAGNLEKAQIAFSYGADAVYIGGKNLSLRAGADNFSLEDIEHAITLAHGMGKKVYIAVNIFAHNRDLEGLPEYLLKLEEMEADGIIISDPGILSIARSAVPSLPVHLSTQANCTNRESARFWEAQGVERIILARELSLDEIREIAGSVSIQVETFVHGAMCVSYSGRCLLSSYLTGRSANRGDCAHPCRWEYQLVERQRPGEFLPVVEEDRGTYILNANDLRMIEYIPQLVKAGIYSFKIEGRMKSLHYVATVVKAYREAIDRYFEDPETWRVDPGWLEELEKVSHRPYSTGFFFNRPGEAEQTYTHSGYIRTHEFVGRVLEYDPGNSTALIEQRNKFSVGDHVEIIGPRQVPFHQTIKQMTDIEGQPMEAAPHPKQLVVVPVDRPVEKDCLLRKPL